MKVEEIVRVAALTCGEFGVDLRTGVVAEDVFEGCCG